MKKRIELLAMYIQQLQNDDESVVKNPNTITFTEYFLKDLKTIREEIDKLKNNNK